MEKIRNLADKHKTIVLYSIFGLLTTVVNYIVYFSLYYPAGLTAVASNAIAWVAAVLFSFFTNKPFVFKSHSWSAQVILRELVAFFGCRVLTGLLETIFLYVLVDVFDMNALVWKLVISIAVVVLNYIGSKVIFLRR